MVCKSSDNPKAKAKHRKGLWSPEEDNKLRNYILKYGHSCWSSVPIKADLQRNGKSCRLRWINYLRPGLKRGRFSKQEEETILTLHHMLGNKWSQIAQHLPGRTDNEIKNYWHSHLKKNVNKTEEIETNIKSLYVSSISEALDPSPSPLNPATRIPSYELMGNIEKPPIDTFCVAQSCNLIKEANHSSPPKLLFAEWLSLDHVHDLNLAKLGGTSATRNGFEQNTNFQEATINGFRLNHRNHAGAFYHGLIEDSSATDMFSSQHKFIDQMPANAFSYISGSDVSSFSVNSDIMYV